MPGTLLVPRSLFVRSPARDRPAVLVGARRAVLRPSTLVALAFAVAAPVSILVAAAGEGRHPLVMLPLLAAGAFAVGCAGDLLGGLAAGLVFWLFFDGFDEHRWGVLGWDGRTDAIRLGVLVAAGLLGALVPYLRGLGGRADRAAADGSGRTAEE